MRTGATGATSLAALAGWYLMDGADGAAGASADGLPTLLPQAASTPGATTPTARAVRARRLVTDGIEGTALAGLTWTQGT